MEDGMTKCTHCAKGKFHGNNAVAAWQQAHCSHCPHGKYQFESGSTKCFICPSGKFSNNNKDKSKCTSCSVYPGQNQAKGPNVPARIFWTKGEAGWNKCVRKPVNCKFSTTKKQHKLVRQWSTCSKSCKSKSAGYGDHQRLLQPIYHAWGTEQGAMTCDNPFFEQSSAASQTHLVWKGSKPAKQGEGWSQSKRCNIHACPIDCVLSKWALWGTCRKTEFGAVVTCGGNAKTWRHRTVVVPPQFGGKQCPPTTQSKPCNTHKCKNPVCHKDHVTCKVHTVHYARRPSATRTTTCVASNGRKRSASGATDPRCHKCDTALECKLSANTPMNGGEFHRDFKTISVKHGKRFMHYNGKFFCKIISVAPVDSSKMFSKEKAYFKNGIRVSRMHLLKPQDSKCQCRCTAHPTACYRKNFVIANMHYIHGNIHRNVASVNKCSNMCTHHPNCGAWEYDTKKVCILKAKNGSKVTYKKNADKSKTTYAGLNSNASNGCVRAKNVVCKLWQYKWIDGATDSHFCRACPAGTTTNGISIMGRAACSVKDRSLKLNPTPPSP
jgi:hypothetical protein